MLLRACVQARLRGLDIWGTSLPIIQGPLETASALLAAWCAAVVDLTRDWATGVCGGGHRWEGPPHEDKQSAAALRRIEQVWLKRPR